MQRNPVDANRPFAIVHETEPDLHGNIASCTTVLLTASECPIGCTMCDLWQNTLPHPTPLGAIPRQIDRALSDSVSTDALRYLKLYNSGNFFDPQSIPPEDYPAIAQRCQPFDRVIVENHPRLGVRRMLEFNDLLDSQLEVAVGLETVQPRWLQRMEKQMTRDDFDGYARFLLDHGIDLRVFLIVGVPGISAREAICWARLSVRHAILAGARHISLIPARPGHGWSGQADKLPLFSAAQVHQLHLSAERDAQGFAIITLDQWGRDPGSTDPGSAQEGAG